MKTDGRDYGAKKSTTTPAVKTPDKPRTLKDWLNENKTSFLQALPQNTINIDRFVASASMEIMNNQNLMRCDKNSIASSLLMAARYGMEVGPLLGQAWLIPYNEKKNINGSWQKVMTCHFQLGYKGLIVLARRSNTIKTISCEIVYENDIFEVELGMGRKLTHKIDIREERGDPIAFYCLVELENGGTQFGVMSKKDVEKHRDAFSKGFDATDSQNIWVKNFDAMALKTVAIRTLKLCPISVEALEAVSREEQLEAGLRDVTPSGDDFGMIPPDEGDIEPDPEAKEPAPEAQGTTPEQKSTDTQSLVKQAAGVTSGKEPTDAELAEELSMMKGEFPEPPDSDDPSLF